MPSTMSSTGGCGAPTWRSMQPSGPGATASWSRPRTIGFQGGCYSHMIQSLRTAIRRAGLRMDRATVGAYDAGAAAFAKDWHDQPAPVDLHALVKRYFHPGRTADVGCGSGREVAFLAANGFDAVGYDASDALLEQARLRYPRLAFATAALPELKGVPDAVFDNVLCETVIMHLRRPQILAAVRRLLAILKPDGVLYLSSRVHHGDRHREPHGRLYSAFESSLIREAIEGLAVILLDDEPISASSGKKIHRIVARTFARYAFPSLFDNARNGAPASAGRGACHGNQYFGPVRHRHRRQ